MAKEYYSKFHKKWKLLKSTDSESELKKYNYKIRTKKPVKTNNTLLVADKSIRSGTKWFNLEYARFVKKELNKKGIKTVIISTTKINKLSGKKRKAYLIKRI